MTDDGKHDPGAGGSGDPEQRLKDTLASAQNFEDLAVAVPIIAKLVKEGVQPDTVGDALMGRVEQLELDEESRRQLEDSLNLQLLSMGVGKLVPPPDEPMAVARVLARPWRDPPTGALTMHHWRGSFWRWGGSRYTEFREAQMRSATYLALEHSAYRNSKRKTVAWRPNQAKVTNVLDAMKATLILADDIDPPIWIDGASGPSQIISCANGLLDVSGRRLLDRDPRYFTLVSVPFDYDATAPTPTNWVTFLEQLWPPDDQGHMALEILALQEFYGYVLSGATDQQKILGLLGPPRSGKGTIARILSDLVGRGNITGPTLASFATNFGLQMLLGRTLAIISDARVGAASNTAVERLLSISGEDSLTVDRKYQVPWVGKLPTRLVFISNELPRFPDASGALVSRFIPLIMRYSWLGKEDKDLYAKLQPELPGILVWALDGLNRLIENGAFTVPPASVEALNEMTNLGSPVGAFLRECCQMVGSIVESDLYLAYGDWCADNGVEHPGDMATFGRDLRAVLPGLRVRRPRVMGRQKRTVSGISLLNEGYRRPSGDDRGDDTGGRLRRPKDPE